MKSTSFRWVVAAGAAAVVLVGGGAALAAVGGSSGSSAPVGAAPDKGAARAAQAAQLSATLTQTTNQADALESQLAAVDAGAADGDSAPPAPVVVSAPHHVSAPVVRHVAPAPKRTAPVKATQVRTHFGDDSGEDGNGGENEHGNDGEGGDD